MSQQAQDQTAFWQNFLTGITKTLGNPDLVHGVMACGSSIVADFDQDTPHALSQLYSFGNTVPAWSLTWNGAFNTNLFGTYQNWVEQISPQPAKDATDDMYTQMQTIKTKITGMTDGINSIMKTQYLAYLQDNCLEFADGSTTVCKTLIPGAPDFGTVWAQYKTSGEYTQQVTELQQQFGDTLSGLQDQFNTLANAYYGPGYERIAEAQSAVKMADPANLNSGVTSDNRDQYQMQIAQNDSTTWVPRFVSGNLDDYTAWLQKQKAQGPKFGQDANIQITFDNQINTKDTSTWKFNAKGGLPVMDFFWLGGGASGSSTQVDVSKYEFKGIMTYQDVFQLNLDPSQNWFFEDLLGQYADYDNWLDGSQFKGKDLWGPNGLLATQIKGVIIGYAPYMKVEVDNWDESDLKTSWSEEASFGIGPFNFESESASGSSEHYSLTQTTSGIEVKDTSGQAHIIALIVDTPNYNG